MPYLIDTCILVDHLRGYRPAHDWLMGTVEENPDAGLFYSAITLTELLAGLPTRQEEPLHRLLGIMDCLCVDEAAARLAGAYLRKWRPSHGLEVPDALIAATAKQHGLVLATLNRRHYPMDDLAVVTPYN